MGFEDGEDDGGYEADDLEVGDEVEQSDEESEGDGEREVDDEESDGEEYAYAEGYDGLSSEVCVHAVFEVGHDGLQVASLGWGGEPEESVGHGFIVGEDEEEVDDGYEGADETYDGAEAA